LQSEYYLLIDLVESYAGYVKGPAGPNGKPIQSHITNIKVQTKKKTIEYGIIVATTVPIPAFLSYF
jgi:hypothetical protein